IIYGAFAPAVPLTLAAALWQQPAPVGGIAPLAILSGLAVMVAGGEHIRVHSQRALGYVWFGLLLAPPALIALGQLTLPWVPVEQQTAQPATAMARFYNDGFARRFNAPLAVVGGEPRLAALIAM